MDSKACDTIDRLLSSVQEEVDDPELDFKLRTARQLVIVCGEQNATYRTTLSEIDLDEDIEESLTSLGYL